MKKSGTVPFRLVGSLDAKDIESDPNAPNPFALDVETEDLHLDDTKKTRRGCYEREGHDWPVYQKVEAGFGKFKCTLD